MCACARGVSVCSVVYVCVSVCAAHVCIVCVFVFVCVLASNQVSVCVYTTSIFALSLLMHALACTGCSN